MIINLWNVETDQVKFIPKKERKKKKSYPGCKIGEQYVK